MAASRSPAVGRAAADTTQPIAASPSSTARTHASTPGSAPAKAASGTPTRSPATDVPARSTNRSAVRRWVRTSMTRAASATDEVMGATWSIVHDSGTTPAVGTDP